MTRLLIFIFVTQWVIFTNALPSSPTFNGCVTKNDQNQPQVIVNQDFYADDNWWYQCVKNKLIARGCVVNGKRYNVDEQFSGYLNNFYGLCESIDGKYLKSTIQGCLDRNGNQIDPGSRYIADQYFWANCTSTKKTVATGAGNVDLDVIGRQIIGCNDGTYDIIKDGDNFADIRVDQPLLAGVGLVCKSNQEFPQVQPVVCLVANSTKDVTYTVLTNKCYTQLEDYLYYCAIAERDWRNGTLEYAWEIGWNTTTPENLNILKSNDFHTCENQSSQNSTTHPTPTGKEKRQANLSNGQVKLSDHSISVGKINRFDHLANWLQASSKFIITA